MLKDFKKHGSKIFMVSDFYCGKETVEFWLDKLGILELFDDVFVSCDYKKSKLTGALYQHIISCLKVPANEILMIGDNLHSDVKMAKRVGINAKHIRAKKLKTKHRIKSCKIRKIPENYKQIFNNYGKNFNFSNYAFPLYIFTKRLAKKLVANGAKNVFFLAREGKFMKVLFDEFCSVNNIEISSHYLEVSRNSVMVPTLKALDEEKFQFLLREVKSINIQTFLSSLDFPEEVCREILTRTGLNFKKEILDFLNSEEFKILKADEVFHQTYEQHRQNMRSAFEKYLKSFQVDFEKEGLNVVDVGWLGTMQDFLDVFFEGRVDVKGFYVGCRIIISPPRSFAYA